MLKRKIIIGSAIVLVVIFAGPLLFYKFELPSNDDVSKTDNIKAAFSSWKIDNELKIPNQTELPPDSFKCSVCYPYELGSGDCKERMAGWIGRSVLSTAEPNQKMLLFHFKGYFLSKAIEAKFDEENIYRLYLSFLSNPLKSANISQACQQRFQKSCSSLSAEESVELEISARTASSEKNYSDLKQKILEKCK